MKYEVNIGLEVHLQLSTESKAFCSCSTRFGSPPNTQTCPVCLGLPGSLPVLNRAALASAIKVALALNCIVAERTKFDRKNYYYPDLPKNFQISQYDMPLSQNGFLMIYPAEKNGKKIRIKRVHLEEDAGKLFHKGKHSLIDYNRAGTPLLEIVSEPDLSSPDEAYAYLTFLKSLLRYLDVSDCNMEEGSLRCDANISLRKEKAGLGTKTELKNMNSFKNVRNALEYEIERQSSLLNEGSGVIQETRLWDTEKAITTSMRSKEEAHDYRYFPEPDLAPFIIDKKLIEKIRGEIPELPQERKMRFILQYSLSEYDASVLTQEKRMADFFEQAVKIYDNPKAISNWLMGDISAILNERNISIDETRLSAANVAKMAKMLDEGTISTRIAKTILSDMVDDGEAPDILVEKKGLSQISDADELENVIMQILKQNEKTVKDYKSGRKNALVFLVGQVMKASRGKANPKMVNEILRNKLAK